MVGLLLFIVFAIGLLRDYGKWLCITIATMPFLAGFLLWGQSLMVYLGAFICLLYMKNLRLYRSGHIFPLTISLSILIIAYITTNYFAVEKHNGMMISLVLNNCVIIAIFFHVYLSSARRLSPIFIKTYVIFGAIVGFYSCFEVLTNSNPLMEMLLSTGQLGFDHLGLDMRFGLRRAIGIFAYPSPNGAVAILSLAVILGGLLTGHLRKTKFLYIIIASLIFTVFATGTRSVILGFAISSLAFINFKMLNFKALFGIVLTIAILYMGFNNYIDNIINSFINTESVDGSSSSMREGQFELATYFFLQSPIYGNGISFTGEHLMGVYKEIYGAESLWIPVMVDTGLLGLIGHILYFILSIRYCITSKAPYLAFIIIGFVAFNTLSSIPQYNILWLFPIILVLTEMYKTAS